MLAAYQSDLYIVAAFGQILPQAVLDLPRYGTLNIHASLLPKYRGVSPISEAILQGDTETGVTIMLIDAGVDTGPIIIQAVVKLKNNDTEESLSRRILTQEHKIYPKAVKLFAEGKIKVKGRKTAT